MTYAGGAGRGDDCLADDDTRAMRAKVDLERLPPITRKVTERIVLASGDLCYGVDLVCSEGWLEAGALALAAGAPVVADSPMVAAGISGARVICKADEPLTQRLSRSAGIAIAAAAVRLAISDAGPGAIWVAGSEPTAIYEIIARGASPALVIGIPAGFVVADEAKKALRGSGLPSLTNLSSKGGPVVAAAACLALIEAASALAPDPLPVQR